MKKLNIVLVAVTMLFCHSVVSHAQNKLPAGGRVGIATTTPHSSSILDVDTVGRGVLFPRMTKTQRDGIATPATGLLIYQTNSTPGFYYYSGSAWTAVTPAAGANTALSNLVTTAINKNLFPSADKLRDIGSKTLRWRDTYTCNVIATDNDQTVPIGSFINTRIDTTVDAIAVRAWADTTALNEGTSLAPWGIGLDASGGFIGASGLGLGLGGIGLYGLGDFGVFTQVFDTTFLNGWGGYFNGHVVAIDYWIFSDRKFKTNIHKMESSLDKIMQLNPSTYNYKSGEGFTFDKKMHYGLLADEVEQVFPEMVRLSTSPTSRDPKTGLKTPGSEFQSVNYVALIPVLISAIQEQQTEIGAKDAQIALLEERVGALETAMNLAPAKGSGPALEQKAYLQQNSPNPFKDKTVISYFIPEAAGSAIVKVYSLTGTELQSIQISNKGINQVEVSGGSFSPGTYTYQLIVDGRIIDTKLMVITQ